MDLSEKETVLVLILLLRRQAELWTRMAETVQYGDLVNDWDAEQHERVSNLINKFKAEVGK